MTRQNLKSPIFVFWEPQHSSEWEAVKSPSRKKLYFNLSNVEVRLYKKQMRCLSWNWSLGSTALLLSILTFATSRRTSFLRPTLELSLANFVAKLELERHVRRRLPVATRISEALWPPSRGCIRFATLLPFTPQNTLR